VEAVDLTPGMVDVRYGSLVKRHRKEDLSPATARSNPRPSRPRAQRARHNGHALDQVQREYDDIQRNLDALKAATASSIEAIRERLRTASADAKKEVQKELDAAEAPLLSLRTKLQAIDSRVLNLIIKDGNSSRFAHPGEKEDAAEVYLESRPSNTEGKEESVIRAGFSGLGPAGREAKDRRTKIPLTERDLHTKALKERGLSDVAVQAVQEGASWMMLPDPAKYIGGSGGDTSELCGNPLDGTMYVVAVNSAKRPDPVLVTQAIWEEALRNAGDNKRLRTPQEKLEAWTRTGRLPVATWTDGDTRYQYDSTLRVPEPVEPGEEWKNIMAFAGPVHGDLQRVKDTATAKKIQNEGSRRVLRGIEGLKKTLRIYGKDGPWQKDGVLTPLTIDDVEQAQNPTPEYLQPGQKVKSRPGKGQTGKATRGPPETAIHIKDKPKRPLSRNAAYIEIPEGSGDYFYFKFERQISDAESRFWNDFYPPYDRISGKRGSPFFTWQRMVRPLSRGSLEGLRMRTRVATDLFRGLGEDAIETLPAGQAVSYLGSDGIWAHVRVGESLEGYVRRRYLDVPNPSPFTNAPLCVSAFAVERVKAAREITNYIIAMQQSLNDAKYTYERALREPEEDFGNANIVNAGTKLLKTLGWFGSWCLRMSQTLKLQSPANYKNVPIVEIAVSLQPYLDVRAIAAIASNDPISLTSPNPMDRKKAYVFGGEQAGIAEDASPPPLFLPLRFSPENAEDTNNLEARLREVFGVKRQKGKKLSLQELNGLFVYKTLKDVIAAKWTAAALPNLKGSLAGVHDTVAALLIPPEKQKQYDEVYEAYTHADASPALKHKLYPQLMQLTKERSRIRLLRALYFLITVLEGAASSTQLLLAKEHLNLIIKNAGALPDDTAAGDIVRLKEWKAGNPDLDRIKVSIQAVNAEIQELSRLRVYYSELERERRQPSTQLVDPNRDLRNIADREAAAVARAKAAVENAAEDDSGPALYLTQLQDALSHRSPTALEQVIQRLKVVEVALDAKAKESQKTHAEEIAAFTTQKRFHKRSSEPFATEHRNVTLYYTYNPLLFEIMRLYWNTRQTPWTFEKGVLTPDALARLRDVDAIGRYGYALKLFYEKSMNKQDFDAVVESIRNSINSSLPIPGTSISAGESFRDWVAEVRAKGQALGKDPVKVREWRKSSADWAEKNFPAAAILEPGTGGPANVLFREGTAHSGWAVQSAVGAPFEVESFSQDPPAYLSGLRRTALQGLVRQREESGREVKAIVRSSKTTPHGSPISDVPMQPMGMSAGRYSRIPQVGEGKRVRTSFLPQSSIAALEDAEKDFLELQKLIKERETELRKKLPAKTNRSRR
jgi:hypothetical protein